MKCRMQYFTSLAIISMTLLVGSPATALGQLQCQVCGCPEEGQGLSPKQCSGQCKGQRRFQNDSTYNLSHTKASQNLERFKIFPKILSKRALLSKLENRKNYQGFKTISNFSKFKSEQHKRTLKVPQV